MKVGDLVQHIYEGAPTGTVIEIKPCVEGSRGCYRVVVYWGADDEAGHDWDYDLKVVEAA